MHLTSIEKTHLHDQDSTIDVIKLLSRYLVISDLLTLRRLSREVQSTIDQYWFHPMARLHRFMSSEAYAAFRKIQEDSGTLISGSIPLQILIGQDWPSSDLDIYCPVQSTSCLVQFILHVLRFRFDKRWNRGTTLRDFLQHNKCVRSPATTMTTEVEQNYDSYDIEGIVSIITFIRGRNRVQLITCSIAPLELITGFHSTIVMNFITAKNIISLYPRATLLYKVGLCLREGKALAKYRRRGFEFLDHIGRISYAKAHRLSFTNGHRFVGDSCCLVLPLERCQITPTNTEPDPIISQSWAVQLAAWSPNIERATLSSPALKHRYCFVPSEALELEVLIDHWTGCSSIASHESVDIELIKFIGLKRREG